MLDTIGFKRLVGNKIFSVIFTKKDGSERKMLCRLGVKKHLKGGTKKYDAESLNMVTVYSLDSKGYRTINLNTLKQIKAKKTVINFN
jgi:cytochrome c